MSTITVAAAASQLNILKAFAIRLGNTRAATVITELMCKDAAKRAASRTTGWAKSPTGLIVLGALLSDDRVLGWAIRTTGKIIRRAGRILRWAVSQPVDLADRIVTATTSAITKVSERVAIGFDTVAKMPVRIAYSGINATASFADRIFRRVEFSATNPTVISTTAQTAFTVSAVQFLKHMPIVNRLGAPATRALCHIPLLGRAFSRAAGSGWGPLAFIGTVFIVGVMTHMFWNYQSNTVKMEQAAAAVTIAEEQELIYVTVDGTTFTEDEAKELSRRVIAHNKGNKGPHWRKRKK